MKEFLKIFGLNIIILSIILILLNAFSILNIESFINIDYVFFMGVIFGVILLIIYNSDGDNKNKIINKVITYVFILILFLIALNQFYNFDFINTNITNFMIIGVATGFLAFYNNRKRIEKEIDGEKYNELILEENHEKEFLVKFPRIKRIPILKIIVKWMYKEGWIYSFGLISIVILGFILRIWKIAEVPFWFDEFLHISAIEGIRNNFYPAFESGAIYGRSILITYIVYIVDYFTEINEFNVRIIISLISLISIILMYFLSKKIVIKKIAILNSFFLAIYPPFIIISQEVRYYIFLAIILSILYLIMLSKLKDYIKIIIAFILLFLGIESSLLFLGIFILIFFLYYLNLFFDINIKDLIKGYKFFIFLFSIIIITIFILYRRIIDQIVNGNFFNESNFLTSNFVYFTSYGIGILLFILISSLIILFLNYKDKEKLILLSPIFLLFLLSILNTRFSGALRHTTFLIPLILLLASYCYIFIKLFDKIFLKILYLCLFLLIFLSPTLTYLSIPDNHFKIKQDYTWTRPDYRNWENITIYEDSVVLATFPFITKYYTGRVDYAIRIYADSTKDFHTGVPIIDNLDDKRIKNKCIQIFTDYRENQWSDEIRAVVKKDYKSFRSRGVAYYENGLCNK